MKRKGGRKVMVTTKEMICGSNSARPRAPI